MAESLRQLFKDFWTDYSLWEPIFLGTSEGKQKKKIEVLKPAAAAAVKEAVIRLRSGSGSAYWLVCEFLHARMSACV